MTELDGKFGALTLACQEGVATITLDRPLKLNAINSQMLDELGRVSIEVAQDDAIKAVVVTGAGRAFCVGGDLTSELVNDATDEVGRAWRIKQAKDVVITWRTMPKPVIAAVNGPALGAGCSLALACDMVYASEKSSFGMAFVKIGLVPDMGGFYNLTRLAGTARASELMMTGKTIDAREAASIGLVNQVVEHGLLEATVMDIARGLAKGPTVAIRHIKDAIYRVATMDLAATIELELEKQISCLATADFREAASAFVARRPPVFIGK